MNMSSQEFCLKWNNHHPYVLSVLDRLFQNETLVDVTLVAEGKSIKVHRLILAACSTYFQEMVDLHKEKAMVIFLRDVKFSELEALVHYMYRGEVKVAQSNLSSLIRTAESLKIKGLAETDDKFEDSDSPVTAQNVEPKVSGWESPSRKRRRKSADVSSEAGTNTSSFPDYSVVHLKAESPLSIPGVRATKVPLSSVTPQTTPATQATDSSVCRSSNFHSEIISSESQLSEANDSGLVAKFETSGDELDLVNSQNQEEEWNDEDFSALLGDQGENGTNEQGSSSQTGEALFGFSCQICHKKYSHKSGLRRHTKTVCQGRRAVVCQYCHKSYSRKDYLQTHIKRVHPEINKGD